MIKFGLKNIRLLSFLNKIPVLRFFFILKITEKFPGIKNGPVLEKFYTDIYVNSKTSKKTSKNRFSDLDNYSINYLEKGSINILHDVAVSNGISSIDFYNKLVNDSIPFKLFISDKYSRANVKKGFITKVYDTENQFIFGYLGALFGVDKNKFFPLTVLLYHILKRFSDKAAYDYSILLYHPIVLEKLKQEKVIAIDYDVFKKTNEDQFTYIRAMNILNRAYFSDKELLKAIENIKVSMKENGVFLVGRTNAKGINNASFYRKVDGKFKNLKDANAGSEIKELIETQN